MATVTGFTAERMQEIEDQAIVDGVVSGNNLILTRHNGSTINAGSVRGATGPTGPAGSVSTSQMNAAILASSDSDGRGIVDQSIVNADQFIAGFSQDVWQEVSGVSLVFTPEVDRYYRFEAQVAVSSEGTNTLFDAEIRRVGGGTIAAASLFVPVVNRAAVLNFGRVSQSTWTDSIEIKLFVRDNTLNNTRIKGSSWSTILTAYDVGKL